jgi:hypothetical protein
MARPRCRRGRAGGRCRGRRGSDGRCGSVGVRGHILRRRHHRGGAHHRRCRVAVGARGGRRRDRRRRPRKRDLRAAALRHHRCPGARRSRRSARVGDGIPARQHPAVRADRDGTLSAGRRGRDEDLPDRLVVRDPAAARGDRALRRHRHNRLSRARRPPRRRARGRGRGRPGRGRRGPDVQGRRRARAFLGSTRRKGRAAARRCSSRQCRKSVR